MNVSSGGVDVTCQRASKTVHERESRTCVCKECEQVSETSEVA